MYSPFRGGEGGKCKCVFSHLIVLYLPVGTDQDVRFLSAISFAHTFLIDTRETVCYMDEVV